MTGEPKQQAIDEWERLAWHTYERGDTAVPGMYLMLFHGRPTPDTELDDWGYDGPIIGPLEHFHTTYGMHLSYAIEGTDVDSGGPSDVLVVRSDGLLELISPQGRHYFGDWSVFNHKGGEL